MSEPAGGADTPPKIRCEAGLLGVACGAGAALFWALGFVATRHGLKAGFTPPDLLMHRFLWSGLVFFRSCCAPASVISAASDGAAGWC